MEFITRQLTATLTAGTKSLFLLGPRQTGKSTLLSRAFPDAYSINLANQNEYIAFVSNPVLLQQRIQTIPSGSTIIIDEIQRIPSLLNTIQVIIDQKLGYRFLLTGSSARKLRRGAANLLPGRTHVFHLGPVVVAELDYQAKTQDLLAYGSLPEIVTERNASERMRTLRAYAYTYLREEVQVEALTRNMEGFSRFLLYAAVANGQFLDFQKLASQAQVGNQASRRFFEILEDTLIVRRIDAFAKSERTRLIQHPRFVFFDNGVVNGLLENFNVSLDRRGQLFEALVISQVVHSIHMRDEMGTRLSSFRTGGHAEVDLIIERADETFALEIKATTNIAATDIGGLEAFARFYAKPHRQVVAYLGTERLRIGKVEVWPWQELMREIGL